MTNVADDKVMGKLRHNEYYDCQKYFDELYRMAKEGYIFEDLMSIILSRENIMLAYRNIKRNKGSLTAGTDDQTVKDIENLKVKDVIQKIHSDINRNQGYQPKPVRRKFIPKPNGDMRPLGIPCIWDRLIQQCILQVMEPICEAQFNDHSYGFRPGRSAENAIAEIYKNLNLTKTYYVVEFDIKGFFDNVDHQKLLKQIWALGIHDKHLIYIIRQILKAPIKLPDGSYVKPKTGTPQGGILSPLLANIVLNELDWWITSQWENNPVINNYPHFRKDGSFNKGHGYRAMKTTKLKEMRITRYADDFRILCRTRSQAQKVKTATTMWLKERLNLDVSEEKTKIVNAKRRYTEFLGFKIKMIQKHGKWVTKSHICDKKKKAITQDLKRQVKRLAKPLNDLDALHQILIYNAMILGVQNYFAIATNINLDCDEIAYKVTRTLYNRLRGKSEVGRLTKNKAYGRNLTEFEMGKFGKSKLLRFDKQTKSPIYPLNFIQKRNPMHHSTGATPYTENGRKLLHKELGIDTQIMHKLMKSSVKGSIEYADNRISLFCAQWGKDYVTGNPFDNEMDIHCHHITPKWAGGNDKYANLVLVSETVHRLIHATKSETIRKIMEDLPLSSKSLKKLNTLRQKAFLDPIKF